MRWRLLTLLVLLQPPLPRDNASVASDAVAAVAMRRCFRCPQHKTSLGSEACPRLGPGDFFGERAILTGEPRAATVTAVQQSRLLALDRATFIRLLGPLSVRRARGLTGRSVCRGGCDGRDRCRERWCGTAASAATAAAHRVLLPGGLPSALRLAMRGWCGRLAPLAAPRGCAPWLVATPATALSASALRRRRLVRRRPRRLDWRATAPRNLHRLLFQWALFRLAGPADAQPCGVRRVRRGCSRRERCGLRAQPRRWR